MANYEEARVKLLEKIQVEELLHELFSTTRQKTKIRNIFANNMSTDIKLSKAQISKTIQSGGFLGTKSGNVIGNLGKKTFLLLWLKMFCINYQLKQLHLPSAINRFERKISGRGAVRA